MSDYENYSHCTLVHTIHERDDNITRLELLLSERDADIARLDGLLEVRNRELDAMRDAAKKGDRSWQECYHDGQREIERLRREIQELRFNRLHGLHAMARRLGVPSKWLKEQAEASSIPCLKAGSKYIFCPKAVEQAVRHRAANGFIGG